jgi:hypothetical protein
MYAFHRQTNFFIYRRSLGHDPREEELTDIIREIDIDGKFFN